MESDASFFDMFNYPIVWVFLFVYFLPTVVAISRNSSGWVACLFVNLLFGWTLIGWIIAIILAALPSKATVAYRKAVSRARDDFYLREAAKSDAN